MVVVARPPVGLDDARWRSLLDRRGFEARSARTSTTGGAWSSLLDRRGLEARSARTSTSASVAAMMWVFAVLIVLAMGGIAMVAAGRGAPMVEVYDDRPDALVPTDRDLGAEDLRRVRFPLAFRGYRMGEVDALLARLAREMEARDRDSGDPTPGPDTAQQDAPQPGTRGDSADG